MDGLPYEHGRWGVPMNTLRVGGTSRVVPYKKQQQVNCRAAAFSKNLEIQ